MAFEDASSRPNDSEAHHAARAAAQGRAIVFVVTEDWYFLSHRLPVARAAARAGYRVVVATRGTGLEQRITDEGFTLAPLDAMHRTSRKPLQEAKSIAELVSIYRRFRPALVHHVGLKPILYGSIAAQLTGVPGVVNAMGGLGFVFSSDNTQARLLRPMIRLMMRTALPRRGSLFIVQNPDDQRILAAQRMVDPARIRLIAGSGVDIDRFQVVPDQADPPVVLLACRMIWGKGVRDFAAMAELLRARGVRARFVLAGAPDTGNPAAVPIEQLEAWQRGGSIEWWGHRTDMPAVYAQASIVCLPSTYGEGVPKAMIEAAACGRPLVSYDTIGCREIVRHERNGLTAPPRSIEALAAAVERLVADPALRARFGAEGRKLVEAEFCEPLIVAQTLELYRELNEEASS